MEKNNSINSREKLHQTLLSRTRLAKSMEFNRKIIHIIIGVIFVLASLSVLGQPHWQSRMQIKLPTAASAITYSPDKKLIAVGHSDGKISIWNTETAVSAGSFEAHKGKVESIRFTPKGDQLITLGEDKRARIWKISDWSDQGVIDGLEYAFAISG